MSSRKLTTRLALPLILCCLGPSPSARAATRVWDGGGANALWATANNWSPNNLPTSATDVILGSAFTSGKNIILSGNRTVNSLTFSNASGVTLSASQQPAIGGHLLSLNTGDITVKGYGLSTIDCRLHLVSPGVFHVPYSTKLESKRSITGAPPPADNAYFFYSGIQKTGEGELILGGTNTFGGVLYIEDGKLTVTSSNALPYTILYVRGYSQDSTDLHLGANVTPHINYLLLEGTTIVTGGSGAKLYADSIGLRDDPDVDLVLAGTADVLVAAGAEPILRRANSFTGDLTLSAGSHLTVKHDSGLGAPYNTIHVTGNAQLTVDDLDGLTAGQRTLLVDDLVQVELTIDSSLDCQLAGPGTVVVTIDGDNTIDLSGDNSAFTGRLFSNKNVEVRDVHAFGDAERIIIEASRDITFFDSIDAPGTDLESTSGTIITLNNRNVTLHHLRVGTGSPTVLQLSSDTTNRTLDLADIVFVGATGSLHIQGWKGTASGSTGDRVQVSGSLSASELQRITLNGMPVKKLNGELVLAQ